MSSSEEIILVAGANYPKTHRTSPLILKLVHGLEPGQFSQLCLRYSKAASRRQSSMKFTLFDFFTGQVAQFAGADILRISDFSKFESVADFERRHAIAKFQALSSENYVAVEKKSGRLVKMANPMTGNLEQNRYLPYFDGLAAVRKPRESITVEEYARRLESVKFSRSLSITDVYEYILEGSLRGAIEPFAGNGMPSIGEFHFFSHSYYIGPILVNSIDENEDQLQRFSADRDGRVTKDFDKGNMQKVDDFRKRFTREAFSVIWGCIGFNQISEPIKQAMLKTRGIGVLNFHLKFDKNMEFATEDQFHQLYGGQHGMSEEMNLAALAQRINNLVGRTKSYAEVLARVSGVPAYSLPPGASSDFDENKRQKSTALMHVAPEDLVVVKFFRNYLNAVTDLGPRIGDVAKDFDEEVGRGFVRYAPQ